MADFLSEWYQWIKAGHVIAVMAWMAGMLYLPRLFVYHAVAEAGSELSETLKIMERRLLRAIINPAMAISMIFAAVYPFSANTPSPAVRIAACFFSLFASLFFIC